MKKSKVMLKAMGMLGRNGKHYFTCLLVDSISLGVSEWYKETLGFDSFMPAPLDKLVYWEPEAINLRLWMLAMAYAVALDEEGE